MVVGPCCMVWTWCFVVKSLSRAEGLGLGLDSEEGVEALAPVEGVAVIDDEVAARGGFVGGDAGEVG